MGRGKPLIGNASIGTPEGGDKRLDEKTPPQEGDNNEGNEGNEGGEIDEGSNNN